MKRTLLILLFLLPMIKGNSQNASVEKHIIGIQAGYSGFWGHYEMKLGSSTSLRTEIGLDLQINGDTKTVSPSFNIEPRWYYNLNNRASKEKKTAGNSGGFITVQTKYVSNLFTLSNYENVKTVPRLSIAPTWGMKRLIGDHFAYELGLGAGYALEYFKDVGYNENESGLFINLHLRIGYHF